MKQKKAQLAIPFHWIFIMIAGAIILLFFITIVFKQKAVAEEKLSVEILSSIEEIFAGAGSGEEETIAAIEIPKTELNFICEEDTGISEYSIKDTGISKQTPGEIMYSPDIVKGKELVIWSLPFSFPFKITNLIMVSSSDVRYVFYYGPNSESFAEQLALDMPDSLNVDLIREGEPIGDKKNYKVRFIFIDVDPTTIDLSSLKTLNKDVSAVKIESDNVKFYEKKANNFHIMYEFVDPTKASAIYLPSYNNKDAMYYGAVFSENPDQYRCNLKKIFKRTELVAEIYKDRTEILRQHYPDSSTELCKYIYPDPNSGPSDFDKLISSANTCFEDLDTCSSVEGSLGIEERNENLKGQGCLLIY